MDGRGEAEAISIEKASVPPLKLEGVRRRDVLHHHARHARLLSDDRQIWRRRSMQDGMERLDREIIDLPRKWRRRRSHFLAVCASREGQALLHYKEA